MGSLLKELFMKKIYLFIPFLVLLFIGCTSTYNLSKFPSKEKFTEDFNSSVQNKKVKVTLVNDSSVWSFDETKLVNDSLIVLTGIKLDERSIPSDKIKNIKYDQLTNFQDLSGNIYLINGEMMHLEGMVIQSDSSIKYNVKEKEYRLIPIRELKEVSYNKNWLGIPFGLVTGAGLGLIEIGLINGFSNNGHNPSDTQNAAISLTFIASGILGYIVGYTYTYQFSP